ncbi:hypothetical protein [Acidocella sp.]|uniref:hypothetical protein n=1 Tax=Acidocella sp. TaxID=50710 RepID=UPI003D03717B
MSIFLPIAVLIMEVMPTKAGEPGPSTRTCEACGGTISTLAPHCPHCGHPQRIQGKPSVRNLILEWSGVTIISVSFLAILAFYYGSGDSAFLASPRTFPACDSYNAKSQVENAIAKAPMGKLLGLSIISWDSETQISSTESEEECQASITMNNGQEYQAAYKFYLKGDQIFVEFRLN